MALKLTLVDTRLKETKTIELPTHLPVWAQGQLQKLDADQSGDIVVCTSSYCPQGTKPEMDRPRWDSFARLFGGFAGDSPYNDFKRDEASREERAKTVHGIQREVFNTIRQVLKDRHDLDQWDDIKRVLMTFADYDHLEKVADVAFKFWNDSQKKDFFFLQIAKDFLWEARILAADTSWGQDFYLKRITEKLDRILPLLTRLDDELLEAEKAGPYILEGQGGPIKVTKAGLQAFEMRVTVPKGYPIDRIVNALNAPVGPEGRPKIRFEPSPFGGVRTNASFQVTAQRVVTRIDPKAADTSSLIFPKRIDKVLLQEQKARDYYLVSFSAEPMDTFLDKRPVTLMDIVIDVKQGMMPRRIPKSFVVDNTAGEDPIVVEIIDDLHVSRADLEDPKLVRDGCRTSPPGGDFKKCESMERWFVPSHKNLIEYLQLANPRFVKRDLHFVLSNGDEIDYINANPAHRGIRPDHETNLPFLDQLLGRREFPLWITPGNHNEYFSGSPRTANPKGLADAMELEELFGFYVDSQRVKCPGPSKLNGVLALMTRPLPDCVPNDEGGIDILFAIGDSFYSEDPFKEPADLGFGPHYRRLEMDEARLIDLGHGQFIYMAKTNGADFELYRWMFERLPDPEFENLPESVKNYLDRRPGYLGFHHQVWPHLLKSAQRVMRVGGQMSVGGHVPLFYLGIGSDQDKNGSDAQRGPARKLAEMIAYALRYKNGRSVIPVVFAAHEHRVGEYTSKFKFDSWEEKNRFDRDLLLFLKDIMEGRTTGKKIEYRTVDLWDQYRVGEHSRIEPYLDPQKGFPGPIGKRFNTDSIQFGREEGTFFSNGPSLGPNTPDSPSGFTQWKVYKDGRMTVNHHYLFSEKEGESAEGPATMLPELKRHHRERVRQWKISHGDEPLIPEDHHSFTLPKEEMPNSVPRRVSFLPGFCQWAESKSKFCVRGGAGVAASATSDQLLWSWMVSLGVTFPLGQHFRRDGLPKYLRVEEVLHVRKREGTTEADFVTDLRFGFRGIEPHFYTNWDFGGSKTVLGGGLIYFSESSMILPEVQANWEIRQRPNFVERSLSFALKWHWDFVALYFGKIHKHAAGHPPSPVGSTLPSFPLVF